MKLLTIFSVACFGLLGLTILDVPAQDEPKKNSVADLEKLVKDLGSESLGTRNDAAKRLREFPPCLHYLRRNMAGQELIIRRRIDAIINDLARARFHQRFAALAKEKRRAPLDLIYDLLLENREFVGDNEWKLTIEVIRAIAAKVCDTDKKIDLWDQIPDPNIDLRQCKSVIGRTLLPARFLGPSRVIADRMNIERGIGCSIVLLSNFLETKRDCGRSILFTSNEPPPEPQADDRIFHIGSCFVYCDTSLACRSIDSSIVIARGEIYSKSVGRSFVIRNARECSTIKLFTAERIGIITTEESKRVRVSRIVNGSLADRAGVKRGDLITVECGAGGLVSTFERALRRAYARDSDFDLNIHRDGRHSSITLSLIE